MHCKHPHLHLCVTTALVTECKHALACCTFTIISATCTVLGVVVISKYACSLFDGMSVTLLRIERICRLVNMAYLAVVGSKAVNGVAYIHSEIIKETIFKVSQTCCCCCFANAPRHTEHVYISYLATCT